MYIEFQLPQGAAGWAAQHALHQIKQEIAAWSIRYGIPYTQKTVKYTHRLAFDNQANFTLFSMTWPSDEGLPGWYQFKIVNIENERY